MRALAWIHCGNMMRYVRPSDLSVDHQLGGFYPFVKS